MKLAGGNSQKDRITFRTQSGKTATAIRKENDQIEIDFTKKEIPIKAIGLLLVLFIIPCIIKEYVLLPKIEAEKIGEIWYLLPMFVSLLLCIYSIIYILIKDKTEMLRNHGAEHMVVAAYDKLGRIPTVEEVEKFPRANKMCGISVYSAFITSQLIGFIVFLVTGYQISEILLFIIPLLFSNTLVFSSIGMILQILFTTRKPKRRNIELAIAALTALEELEKTSKSDEVKINISIFNKNL